MLSGDKIKEVEKLNKNRNLPTFEKRKKNDSKQDIMISGKNDDIYTLLYNFFFLNNTQNIYLRSLLQAKIPSN